jgi:hypothetical protein
LPSAIARGRFCDHAPAFPAPEPPLPALLARLQPKADGSLLIPPTGDYLFLTHSEAGWSWTFPCVETRLRYDVWFDTAGVPTFTTVTAQYRSRIGPDEGRYGCAQGAIWDPLKREVIPATGTFSDYLRAQLAPGTTLLRTEGFTALPHTFDESGAAVVAGLVRVPRGESRTVRIDLRPPDARATPGEYRLFMRKQSGTDTTPVELALHAVPGTTLRDPATGATVGDGGEALLTGDLRQDLRFSVRLTAAGR